LISVHVARSCFPINLFCSQIRS